MNAPLGCFEDYASMERASEMFVALLQGKPIAAPDNIENVANPRLDCGHEAENAVEHDGRRICRKCRSLVAERQREKRLPDQLARARMRVASLEAELQRRGVMA